MSKSKEDYSIPQFDYSLESRMACCCALVNGECSVGEEVDCEDCLFDDGEMSHSKRKAFEEFWKATFEKGGK